MTINTSCEKCGGATRLVGIEPHPRLADTDSGRSNARSCGDSEIAAHPLGTAGMTPAAKEAAGQPLN